MLDQTSLLIAIGFSACAIMLTLVLTWLGTRADRYLLSWGIGLGLVVPGIGLYGLFEDYVPVLQFASFALLFAGFAAIAIGSAQFHLGKAPAGMLLTACAAATGITGLGFAAGFSGVGTILANIFCAGFFLFAAHEHWRSRAESVLALSTLAALYAASAMSFVICAVVLLANGQFVLTMRPDNWAEDLNTIVLIVALAAAGAMAMAVHQARKSATLRDLAMTDSLTGLLNRRALFDLAGADSMPPATGVIMLDLDDFKTINDRFGHAVGDDVLTRFAGVVEANLRPTDRAARIGGEEFCVLLPNVDAAVAQAIAQRIRIAFAATPPLPADYGSPTVSAGIAVSANGGETFDALLREADALLYRAKNAGRNRVHGPEPRLVA